MNTRLLTISHSYLAGILLWSFLLSTFFVFAQDPLVPEQIKAPRIKRGLTKHPQSLSSALTEGLETDKEKFDVIFAWVVGNIRYDQRLYDSGKAIKEKPLKRILRKRKGVCTDYARLMDSLCYFAGIQNTTVNGYIKEIIFDVDDTLYFDTHAWNAVKLDNRWYLYDATWSSGYKSYELTRFGKWRQKRIDSLWKYAKVKTLKLKIKKKKNKFCGIPGSKELSSIEIVTLPWLPRILINILSYPVFRLKEKYTYVANTNYYLAEPEVFSLDHFPNDPIWSLSSTIHNAQEFSADSAYYYRDNSIYTNQHREGRTCIKCDDFLMMDEMNTEKNIISRSLKNNPENHFVPASSNMDIAELFLDQMIAEEDSLAKMNLFDSTLYYLNMCKAELKSAKAANRKEPRFQLRKNKNKRNELLKENKVYWTLSSKAFRETKKRQIKMKSLGKKTKSYEKRGKQEYKKFIKALEKYYSTKKLLPEKVIALRNDLAGYEASSDSLTLQIAEIQDSFINHASDLWKNLLEELDILMPLGNNISTDGAYRAYYMLDNYDRIIREIRKEIKKQALLFISTVDTNILQLADQTYAELILMNRLIKKRNALNVKSARIMAKLRNGRVIPYDSIVQFREEKKEQISNDACWNTDNKALLQTLQFNFSFFYHRNKAFFRLIRNNSAIERSRHFIFDKHINRNKKRNYNAIEGTTLYMNNLKKILYLERNSYLKKLREERKD